jgi:D-arginine dehydrogenase
VNDFDFAIIGSGIAGASCAYFLAPHGRLVLLEREPVAAYHTTGRSAAFYSETYGGPVARALTVASGGFYRSPPEGFCEHPVATPRGSLICGKPGDESRLDRAWREYNALVASVRRVGPEEARRLCPILAPAYAGGGVYEPDALDLDVAAIHDGFLRGARGSGAELRLRAGVIGLSPVNRGWGLCLADGETLRASVVINAAGAWADRVASLAGAPPVGLAPLRRTAFTFDAPAALDLRRLPILLGIHDDFYVKPEAHQLLASPADETPSEPCDAAPDALDVAVAVERIQQATSLRIDRVRARWAGLRSFVPDRGPVIGYDELCEGFFWLAGQGGFGIQSAPGAGRAAAALALGKELPAELRALGLKERQLSPARLRRSPGLPS